MSEEVEEIENIVNKFKEKYPEARMFLDDMVYYAKWTEDRANWCQYERLFDDFGNFRASMISAIRVGNMYQDDILDLLDTDYKLRSHIEKKILEKCGCELPIH